jgi:hypothetical protein
MFVGGIVLFNVKLVSLLETGTCASGNTPYQISQPCPAGETATVWCGYMEGAVRSGERAAEEVLDAEGWRL